MHSQSARFHSIMLAYILLSLSLLLTLASCGGDSGSTPDAHKLISDAQVAIQKVTSYHFNLQADNPGAAGSFTITKADGDIQTPDKLKANATALVLGNAVQVQVVAIGNQQYVTDPLTNSWQKTTGLIDPRSLSDPQT
ncbi:MAG: LppX_LprAFG lipoprotein, partial [Chloroflexota bacterium]|nr:LppX_LprAFG lipoprotein [Chloroflexota bacterium]